MNWYVYIARAKTGRFYTGMSTNPVTRLNRHNSGEGSKFAKQQGPFNLVYVSQAYKNKFEARRREIQIKDWSKTKKERLISGEFK